MIDYNKFDSDIDVEDSELAYELLDSTLDDTRAILLRTIGKNMATAEDKADKGKTVAYCVVGIVRNEVENHIEMNSIANALSVYVDWLNANAYGYDEVVFFRCEVDSKTTIDIEDTDYEETVSEQAYDCFYSGSCEILARKKINASQSVFDDENEHLDLTADELAYERYKRGEYAYEDYVFVCEQEETEPLPRIG